MINFFNEQQNSIFKFVISDKQNFEQTLQFIQQYGLKKEKIYLMPEGITDEQLKQKAQWIIKKCLQYGFNFTPRVHIWAFGNKRGV